MKLSTTTIGSYQVIVSKIIDGYGDTAYRVKVTYNHGNNMAFLKSYSSERAANTAAQRELKKIQ